MKAIVGSITLLAITFSARAQFQNVQISSNNKPQKETTIAICPDPPIYVLAAWNDFPEGNDETSRVGYSFSTNGGRSWQEAEFEGGSSVHTIDPSAGFDRNGNAFLSYITNNGVFVSRTNDFVYPYDLLEKQVDIDFGHDLASGIYLYTSKMDGNVRTRKMLLLR